jgi:O-antigen/teichoic acid export membrane protein
MARNVLASWAAQVVFVVAGFIMPRFLDRHLGQELLGVWDFGWSLVGYFGLVQVGIGSSVHPFVAKYRARHDAVGLNRAVSSAMCLQVLTAATAGVVTLLVTWALPALFGNRLGAHMAEAQWLVLLLGASICISILLNSYGGVLIGCYRWNIYNAINAGYYAATVAVMILALLLGAGVRTLAAVNLGGTAATEITRAFMAYHVCPELRVRFGMARWSEAVRLLGFGAKTMLSAVAGLLLNQTNSMIIAAYLGPAALALYSRPRSLVGHAQVFVNKFGFVLGPTASSLHAGGQQGELRELLMKTSRLATYLALPMVLLFVIMGNPILHLWMGSRYEQGLVLGILAVGQLADMTRQPLVNILTGMNLHGKLGFVNLGVAISSAVLGIIGVGVLGWGLVGAAMSLALPLLVVNGIYMPIHACRRLGMPLGQYVVATSRGPLLCAVPFAACLVAARMIWPDSPVLALGAGLATGGVVLVPLYWKYALPPSLREKLAGLVT